MPTKAETLAVFATAPTGALIVELASVELSRSRDFQLLERTRIEQILAEQQLSTITSESDSLLLGRLLGVEMFAIWEKGAKDTNGRILVFDGKTGIRIEDRALDAADPVGLAHQFADRVRTIAMKHREVDQSTLALISLAPVRNIDLPPNWQNAADQFVARLQQSLTQLPAVGLLERSRLRFVLKEGMLPVANIQAHLLSAAETLTVQLSRMDQQTIKVELLFYRPGDPNPKSLTREMHFDASEADIVKLTDETANSIAPLLMQPLKLSQDVDPHNLEWKDLQSDARRHAIMQQPYSAAVRYEAAYVLSGDPDVLISLQQSIYQCMLITSQSNVGTARGQYFHGAKDVTAEQWRDCVELGRYLLGLRLKIHQNELAKPTWPFLDDERFPANTLTTDFSFPYGIGSAVLTIDPELSPVLYSDLRVIYEDFYETVFTKFANDARSQLSGEKLLRFEAVLWSLMLQQLTKDQDRHCLKNWDDRFVSVFASNLKYNRWLQHLYSLRESVRDLSVPAKERLFKSFSEVDAEQNPIAGLAARYFVLNEQSHTRGFVYSDAFQSQLIQLVSDIADQIERVDDQAALKSRDFVTTYVRTLKYQESRERYSLGLLFDFVCSLTPDPDHRREVYTNAYFRLLNQGILCSEVLKNVVTPTHFKYIAEDLGLLDKTIEIVSQKRFGLEDRQYEALKSVVKEQRDRVEKPFSYQDTSIETTNMPLAWKSFREIPFSVSGIPHQSLIAAQIIEDDIFVLATEVDTGAKSTRVLLYRMSRIVDTDMIQIGKLEIPQLQMKVEAEERKVRNEVPDLMTTYFGWQFLPNAIVKDQDHVFVKTEGGGVLAFPLGGAPAFKIDTTWGLSSNCIQQILPVDGGLLCWVGEEQVEANFVSINLQTKQIQTLASCQRKDAKTPLDNFPRATCGLMMAQDKNRVIIVMDDGYDPESGAYAKRNGVWRYERDSAKFSTFPSGGFQSQEFGRTAEYEFTVGRYDSESQERRWRLFKLNEDRWYEIGLVAVPSRVRPIAITDSLIWWHQRDGRIAYRQKRELGTVDRFRIIPEGFANRLTLQFFPGCDSAMICSEKKTMDCYR